jgi:hypothetical protein
LGWSITGNPIRSDWYGGVEVVVLTFRCCNNIR